MSKVRELLLEKRKVDRWLLNVDELARAVEQDEAEAAKALPAMPDNIRKIVDVIRSDHYLSGNYAAELVAFLDATFPKPVPQWELDAQYLEKHLGHAPGSFSPEEVIAIAQRIRESNRGK